jgi:hypothetical protein
MTTIHMICMENHPVSVMYQRAVESSWKDYTVKKIEAVTPKDLPYKRKLDFEKKLGKNPREFTATEKAVWYSHFERWCWCARTNIPLVVIEHDALLVNKLPDLSKEGYKFLSFVCRDWLKKPTIDIAPGSGYYITPHVASRLITKAVIKPITQNSDGHISTVLNWNKQNKMNDFYYIEQINFDGLNTIDHRNPSTNRKFVGPDYEDFDIPSLHR